MSIAERPGNRGWLDPWEGIRRSAARAVGPAGWIESAAALTLMALDAARDRAPGEPGAPGLTGLPLPGATPGDMVAAAFETYQREIHSFALHSTRDAEVAADVTQEAFLKLLREVSEARTPDNVRAWLYRVTTNLIINRAKRVAVADRVRRAWRGEDETVESPETLSVRREQREQLRRALGELPKDARTGLLLAAHGFSGREIADAIGRTELATRTLLCRARLQLRTALSEPAGER